MSKKQIESIESRLAGLNEQELRRLLVQQLTTQKLGMVWERDVIARDEAINADVVLPEFIEELSCRGTGKPDDSYRNLIIEGDNFDSLRLLKTTHANKIRVIYIDPPYNTGNKDWVYNDSFVGQNDRWRHSQWLEFLYRRLELARDLLTPDGVIMVSINDENRARLELLMDEVFPERRVGSLVWRKRRASNAAGVEHFFSSDHECVLVYANDAFDFNGSAKSWSGYTNWDEAKQDFWTSDNLTLGFNAKERKNLFFPLHNPVTNIWYPCDWNNVWRYASAAKLDGKEVRTQPMEDWIAQDGIYFRDEESPAVYESLAELKKAIAAKKAPPFLDKSDDLEFWIDKKIGFNKPRFKRYKKNLRNETQPLSSWVAEAGKPNVDDADDESVVLASGMTSEGTKLLRGMNLDSAFPYPKPLSLIQGLLSQATRPNDTVLDFFAGSGTTGHAVLALNALDGGNRKFILCSSTEATDKEPDKNLCRDVCAKRIRKVIANEVDAPNSDFAYLQLSKLPPEDARMDFTPEQAFNLLNLRSSMSIKAYPPGPVKVIHSNEEMAIAYLPEVNAAAIKALIALPQSRLAVYSARPQTVAEKLEASGKEGNSYAIGEAILSGQAGNLASTVGVDE